MYLHVLHGLQIQPDIDGSIGREVVGQLVDNKG